jgi:regulator of sigma E protease
MPAVKDEEAFSRIPLKSRILFALAGPAANILGAFFCLSLVNIVRVGFSINSVIYFPLAQIAQMAMQIGVAIPVLFRQPENLSGIVGIVAAGGAHVEFSFVKLLQFSVLLNVNFATLNLLPILPLDGGKIVMGLLRKIYQPLGRLEIPLTVGGWVLLAGLTFYVTALDLARVAHCMISRFLVTSPDCAHFPTSSTNSNENTSHRYNAHRRRLSYNRTVCVRRPS